MKLIQKDLNGKKIKPKLDNTQTDFLELFYINKRALSKRELELVFPKKIINSLLKQFLNNKLIEELSIINGKKIENFYITLTYDKLSNGQKIKKKDKYFIITDKGKELYDEMSDL